MPALALCEGGAGLTMMFGHLGRQHGPLKERAGRAG
jgi:hypothetical protein